MFSTIKEGDDDLLWTSKNYKCDLSVLTKSTEFKEDQFWDGIKKRVHRKGANSPWNRKLMNIIEKIYKKGKLSFFDK